jgi:hypothetical protein
MDATGAANMDKRAVMKRAWQLFGIYGQYPRNSFSDAGGREAFAFWLRQAWQEAREAAAQEKLAAEPRGARIVALRREIELLAYREDYRAAEMRRAEIRSELGRLAA